MRCQQNLNLKTSVLTLKCTVAYNDIHDFFSVLVLCTQVNMMFVSNITNIMTYIIIKEGAIFLITGYVATTLGLLATQ